MSDPGGRDAAGTGQRRASSGLLEKLMAAVRPEFRAGVLTFDPGDPVFGGDACRVPDCGRTARAIGMCYAHHQRWINAGRPDPSAFAASGEAAGPWFGHAPLAGCTVPGCGFGAARRGLCPRHMNRWLRAGKPDIAGWVAGQPAVAPGTRQAACRICYCQLWAHPGAALCCSHHRQWKDHGCPDLDAFISDRDQPAGGREQADLTMLPDRLRLEVQYALQCRRDDNMIKTKPTTVRSMVRWLAGSRTASLLDRSERDWRAACPPRAARSGHPVALLTYAHRKVTALAEGEGWENEYSRDTWHMRRLGISSRCATLRFAGISQPWLKDLAKRWTRWRLSTGLEAQTCYRGVRALTRISGFLAATGPSKSGPMARSARPRGRNNGCHGRRRRCRTATASFRWPAPARMQTLA